MTAKVATICVKCRHHRDTQSNPTADVWYNHVCTQPDLRRTPEQDPVTGKTGFSHKNDLGQIVTTDQPYPYCRKVNHGNCPHFEGK